jgi:hypothetical protein
MKHVLVSFSLALVAVFTPNTPYRVDDVAMRRAITSTLNYMPSTETNPQREVHAVVVDMPQRASLEYASPESWGALPTFDPPNEESPTKPVLQVALN